MATPAQRLPRYGHHPLRSPDWAGSGHVYRPRQPTATPLYPVVQHHLETFLAQATESDPMGYGVRTAATSACSRSPVGVGACAHQRWGTRHAIHAAWPRSPPTSPITFCPTFPVRQWVLSLPKRLRPFLEGNPYIASAVLRIFIRVVRTTLCRTSPDAPRVAQLGALSFFHRFGSRPRRVLPLSRCRARRRGSGKCALSIPRSHVYTTCRQMA